MGSNEEIAIKFLDYQKFQAGGFTVRFRSNPQYRIWYCSSDNDFITDLPSETNKIWTIVLTRTSNVTFVMYCNDKKVVNVVLSDKTCTNDNWNSYWNREVVKIELGKWNTAADYCRSGEGHRLYSKEEYI